MLEKSLVIQKVPGNSLVIKCRRSRKKVILLGENGEYKEEILLVYEEETDKVVEFE